MKNSAPGSRAALVSAMLSPLIREEVINDSVFLKEQNLRADGEITLGDPAARFQQADFFAVARELVDANEIEGSVTAIDGSQWVARKSERDNDPVLVIAQGQKELIVGYIGMLSTNADTRIQTLKRESVLVNLPPIALAKWHQILCERPLDDLEFQGIQDDLKNTPVAFQEMLLSRLRNNRPISPSTIVPQSIEYFERLIGRYDGESNFKEFVASGISAKVDELLSWKAEDGFRLALLLAVHPSISGLIRQRFGDGYLTAESYESLVTGGDPMSCVAAVEVALGSDKENADSQQSICKLISSVSDSESTSIYKTDLFSAIFRLVYGQMSATHVLAHCPTFYRRLAASAHASLITRCVLAVNVRGQEFIGWAAGACAIQFAISSLVDLQDCPRVLPDLALSQNIKGYIQSRFYQQRDRSTAPLVNQKLEQYVGTNEGLVLGLADVGWFGITDLVEGQRPILPGHIAEKVRGDLRQSSNGAQGFEAFVSVAQLFRMPEELLEAVAEELAKRDPIAFVSAGQLPVSSMLVGIAAASAIAKNERLGSEVFRLLAGIISHQSEELKLDDAFYAGMIACASRSTVSDWRGFVGKLTTYLAFQRLSDEVAAGLHQYVYTLCELDIELWSYCGQAEAALRAIATV